VDRTPVSSFDGLVTSVTQTVGSTWTRISATGIVPTTAKTLRVELYGNSMTAGQAAYFTGVQVELGSVATPFVRAGGTLQGELAACQRYYWRLTGTTNNPIALGHYGNSATVYSVIKLPTTMRTAPSFSSSNATDHFKIFSNNVTDTFNLLNGESGTPDTVSVYNNTQVSGTGGYAGHIMFNNSAAYIEMSAEL